MHRYKLLRNVFLILLVSFIYLITLLLTNSVNKGYGLFEYFSIISFILIYFAFSRLKIDTVQIISPINISLSVFFFKLIVAPYSAIVFGYFYGVLSRIDNYYYLKVSYIISIISFLGFAIGFSIGSKKSIDYINKKPNYINIGIAFIIIGLISNLLLFKDINTYFLSVFTNVDSLDLRSNIYGPARFIGNTGRISLPFGLILLTYALLRKSRTKSRISLIILISSLLLILTLAYINKFYLL
jgi:hypothetical protein